MCSLSAEQGAESACLAAMLRMTHLMQCYLLLAHKREQWPKVLPPSTDQISDVPSTNKDSCLELHMNDQT